LNTSSKALSGAPAKADNRILILDSLRGVAAMIVVYHHVFVFHYDRFEETLGKGTAALRAAAFVSELNHEAVMFFFLLSGFVIYLSTHKLDLGSREGLNHYIFKRFRRILPLYWITILTTMILGYLAISWQHESFSPTTLAGNLLFLQTSGKVEEYWIQPYGLNGPLWSLSYEMFFYMLYPLFFVLVRKAHRLAGRFLPLDESEFGLLSALGLSILAIGLRYLFFTPFFSFLALFVIWYAGCFLAQLYVKRKTSDVFLVILSVTVLTLGAFWQTIGAVTLMVIAKAWLLFGAGYLYYRFRERLLPYLKGIKRGLHRLFFTLGEGSYAIYLLHYPLLNLFSSMSGIPFYAEIALLGLWIAGAVYLEKTVNARPFEVFRRRYV
jgi:peptidoglycan/LPS O-acetylase OafA/YrhL